MRLFEPLFNGHVVAKKKDSSNVSFNRRKSFGDSTLCSPNADFGKMIETFDKSILTTFSMNMSPKPVLTFLKSGSKRLIERVVSPSKLRLGSINFYAKMGAVVVIEASLSTFFLPFSSEARNCDFWLATMDVRRVFSTRFGRRAI